MAQNTWIDPFAFIKGAQEGEKTRQSAQRANEEMFDLQRKRERDDYSFAKQQELDQSAVPLTRLANEYGLAKGQDQMADLRVKQTIQNIAAAGFQDKQGNKIAFDQNDPNSLDYMKQVVSQLQSSTDPVQQRAAATILNREIPQLAMRQLQMNIDNPVLAAQFAKQAGIRNIGDVVQNKDGTYSFYNTDVNGNRQMMLGRSLNQAEASTFIGGLVAKSPLTAYGAQQAVASAEAKMQAAMEKLQTANSMQEVNKARVQLFQDQAALSAAKAAAVQKGDSTDAAIGIGGANKEDKEKAAQIAQLAKMVAEMTPEQIKAAQIQAAQKP